MIRFALLAAAAFVAMEILAYVLHRWLFHGPLWRVHRTHHDPSHGHGDGFEWNDGFSVAFAALSLGLMWGGRADPPASAAFAFGVGVAVYGVLYFVLHDLYAHGRLGKLRLPGRVAASVKRAHGRHHQSLGERGQEPYGLFLFPPRYGRRPRRRRDATTHG